MAAHVFVIDSSARRQQIKTTPGTYLRDVLEEACKRFGKDPEQFLLSDSGRPPKTLDLSLTVRLSGLVNGAKLQLTQAPRSPSVINVALKLPQPVGGQRLQDKFPSNTSLWLVLRKFEEAVAGGVSQKLNLTQRGAPSTETGSGRLEYEQPVIKIMQREVSDLVGLQKTLAQLGYNSGSVLLQLEFKKSGLPMEEAITQISRYFETSAPKTDAGASKPATASSGAHSSAAGQLSSLPDADAPDAAAPQDSPSVAEPSEDVEMTPAPPVQDSIKPFEEPALIASSSEGALQPDPTSNSIQEASTSQPPSDPSISVYKPPSASVPLAAAQASSDSDFTPTVEHAHAHQAVLARAAQNRRLQSDAELAADNARKAEALSTVKSATIRVRFPDQMQVDLTITHEDTALSLYEKVAGMLRDSSLPFELRYTGPKGSPVILDKLGREAQKSLIRGLGWKGRVLVTMVWEPSVPVEKRGQVLKDSLVGQARELSLPQVKDGGRETVAQGGAGRTVQDAKQKEGKGKGDLEAKMKKFLGFGKK
ncbi:GLUT4 regulating protein TUG-domain-containing protein [Elsinoe ampelina]|uniref:GLUT4 regulating protein TUG-domain-containing protein n=1 Tax=Elsinoe ampelina TaxID=302913 RepID=A0A6A6G8Q5_9PEZI|nr:GLUT4 regulating protein TUG-domain-containing protein [Elsinoe ampelina]